MAVLVLPAVDAGEAKDNPGGSPDLVVHLLQPSQDGIEGQLCGFDLTCGEDAVPTEDAFGRFLALLIEYLDQLTIIFHQLVDELHQVLCDLGAKTAIDSTALPSHGKPVGDEDKQKEPDRRRDNDAD